MPIETDRATTFLSQVRKLLEFHSTIDILKRKRHGQSQKSMPLALFTDHKLEPPADYQMPPTDILSGVDFILEKVNQNAYSSQFDMELELSRLIDSAYDSHLVFQFCSQSIFALTVDQPIVSISKDGLALPQVYTLGMCHSKANSFRANRWLIGGYRRCQTSTKWIRRYLAY